MNYNARLAIFRFAKDSIIKGENKMNGKELERINELYEIINQKKRTKQISERPDYMNIRLTSRGNPDLRQNPNDSLSPIEIHEIDTLKEASEKCLSYIAKWDLGGGNWSGGQIFYKGRQIACISYNGRIWDMCDNETIFN